MVFDFGGIMKKQELSSQKLALYIRLMFFIFGGAIFIGHNYIPIYIREFEFISDFMVGAIMSLGFLITTVAQIAFGKIADRSKTKNRVFKFLLIGYAAGMLFLAIPRHNSWLTLLPAVFLFYIFFSPTVMLMDTIVVENVEYTGMSFGKLKCFGPAGACSIAFVTFILGLTVGMTTRLAFLMAIVCASLALLPSRMLPPTKGHARGTSKAGGKAAFKEILRNRRLMLLSAFMFVLFIGISATNVYWGVYYVSEDGINAGLGLLGMSMMIGIGFETAIMLYGNRHVQTLGIHSVFTLMGISAFSRSLIVFLAPNIYVIQLSAICGAFTFALLWSRIPPYINEIVPKEMRATGQAVWSIMAFGIGPMLGSILGGAVVGNVGMRNLFGLMSAMILATTVVFFFLFKRQRNLNLPDTLPLYDDD